MWSKTKKVAAFTLMECLLSLVILSGGILVFDGLTRLLAQEVQVQQNSKEEDWLLFSEQLRTELEGSRYIAVKNNRLYVTKSGQSLAFGVSKAGDFRKTNDKGQGYQPMLYSIQSSTIHYKEGLVSIRLTFDNQMERTFVYAVDKNS